MKQAFRFALFAVLFLLLPTTAAAQRGGTCNGILGPQVFHIDFGSGPNPGPPFPPGTTTYRYHGADCAIAPGHYTVRNSMLDCRRYWFDVSEDHTPNDVDGYFMAVDAGDDAGIVWQTTVSGLTPGVVYSLSAAAANLAHPNWGPPDLTFQMEDLQGAVLSSTRVILAEPTTFRWQQGQTTFLVPPNVTDVALKIFTNRGGVFGNDFLIDDLDFSLCYSPMVASFSSTSLVTRAKACDHGRVDLYATWPPSGNPFQNVSYQWQRSTDGGVTWSNINGATAPNSTYFESAPGVYHYRIVTFETANPSMIMASDAIAFYVVKLMVDVPPLYRIYACDSNRAQLTSNTYFAYDDPLEALPGTFTYNWTPPDYLDNPSSPTPVLTLPLLNPPSPGGPPQPPQIFHYQLTAMHPFCTGVGQTTIEYYNPRKVMVPNAFTPNNDGINDVFRPINIADYPGAKFSIYNRWGGLIFESTGPNYDWDGKYQGVDQPIGTYVWLVELPFCTTNIYSSSAGEGESRGTVNLIR